MLYPRQTRQSQYAFELAGISRKTYRCGVRELVFPQCFGYNIENQTAVAVHILAHREDRNAAIGNTKIFEILTR